MTVTILGERPTSAAEKLLSWQGTSVSRWTGDVSRGGLSALDPDGRRVATLTIEITGRIASEDVYRLEVLS